MKVVVQRVLKSSVTVEEKIVGEIGEGLMLLVGFTEGDTVENVVAMAKKVTNLRIFDDQAGVMNESVIQQTKSILSISQFTLYANTKKGNRPSYIDALDQHQANILYDEFNKELKKYVSKVETGIFRANMKVSLVNDGPITIILEI